MDYRHVCLPREPHEINHRASAQRSKTPPTIKALRSQRERVGRSVVVAARLDGKSCCSDIDEKANSSILLIPRFVPGL